MTLKLQQQEKQPSSKPLPPTAIIFDSLSIRSVCVCVLQVYVLASYLGSDGIFEWPMYEAEALVID